MAIKKIQTAVPAAKQIFGTSTIDGTMAEVTTDGSGNLNVNVQAGGAGGNASVGPTGSTAPVQATEIGIIDGSGNLQGVSSTNPIPVTFSSSSTTSSAVSQTSVGSSSASILSSNSSR